MRDLECLTRILRRKRRQPVLAKKAVGKGRVKGQA
jgi:hypothetical protein